MYMRKRVLLSLLIYILFGQGSSYAATYYVSPLGSNFASGGALSPWKTLQYGVSKISSGDTLIVKNGRYDEKIADIPNGAPDRYTIIQAENNGGVMITKPFNLKHTNSYIQFDGLMFNHASCKGIVGNHIKFLRCSFVGGAATGNEVNVVIGTNDFNDTQYILLEDCWAFGSGGRYKILVYNSDKVVLRRVVARDDGGWSTTNSDPEAGIAVYQSSNVSVQNAIVLDSNLSTYHKTNVGAFYLTGHAGKRSSHNVEYLGCMAINNKAAGWSVDTDDGAVGLLMRDNVIYGQEWAGIAQSNKSVAMDIQRLTVGKINGWGMGNWGTKTNAVVDALFFDLGKGTSKGANKITYSNTFNPADVSGDGLIHVNPAVSGLLYLPRIEATGKLKTSGRAGGQMGAQIIYRIGESGTLWGDKDYNTVTNKDLWPWAYESRLKAEMCGVTTRGFCEGGATFTGYIWGYLGNTVPLFMSISPQPQ
jgi:hypothetical protein